MLGLGCDLRTWWLRRRSEMRLDGMELLARVAVCWMDQRLTQSIQVCVLGIRD